MRAFPAIVQFRTTFEQAGRLGQLADELKTTETRLMRYALWQFLRPLSDPGALEALRDEIEREQEEEGHRYGETLT
jgi:predicted transcriptional regulator